jgi:hypothetical protein
LPSRAQKRSITLPHREVSMRPAYRESRIIIVLALLLAVSVAANLYLYPRASRPLVPADQQHWVDRARRHAAAAYGADAGRQAKSSFPIVMELNDRTCVELRSNRDDRVGNFLVCYNPKTRQLLEAHKAGGSF